MTDKAILVNSHLQSHGAGLIHGRGTELLGQSEHALDAADGNLTLVRMQGATEDTDLRAGLLGSPQQLMDAQGSSRRTVRGLDAMEATFLAHMLAHELAGLGVEDPNENAVPLHFDRAADPTRGCTVISGLHFDATIGMDRAFPELVVTERLQRQGQQGWFFFPEHGRHLPLGRAVDAGISPVGFPLIEISLRLLQTFKALALERRFLGMANSRFH